MKNQKHPDQMACNDCSKFNRCKEDGIAHRTQSWCEWEPSRFNRPGVILKTRYGRKKNRGGRMEPLYHIGDHSKLVVLALVETCKKLNQGNVGFRLAQPTRAVFEACMNENNWEVIVSTGYGNGKRDVYQILENELVYQYSEVDIVENER